MEASGRQLRCFLSAFLFIFTCFIHGQANGECPADARTWLPFGQSCYHFVHGEEDVTKIYNIEQAKEMCRGFGLLSVPSVQVNDFIVDYSLKVWKGNINIWLGMYYNTDDDEFKWNDESPLSFKNWEDDADMEDVDLPTVDTCVILHAASGKWENVSCSENKQNGVVCETTQKAVGKNSSSPLLLALVVLCVVVILGVSATFWFIQQRSGSGLSLLPSFEYHPPFRSPMADQTCLVEAEEFEDMS